MPNSATASSPTPRAWTAKAGDFADKREITTKGLAQFVIKRVGELAKGMTARRLNSSRNAYAAGMRSHPLSRSRSRVVISNASKDLNCSATSQPLKCPASWICVKMTANWNPACQIRYCAFGSPTFKPPNQHGEERWVRSFPTGTVQIFSCRDNASLSPCDDGLKQCPRGIAYLFLDRRISVQFVMARCIGLPVPDVAVKFPGRSRTVQADRTKPIGNAAADSFRTLYVSVNHHGVSPAGKLLFIGPSLEFNLLGTASIFSLRKRWIRIATISTNEPIHHQLQRRRNLEPVHGRNDHNAVGSYPQRIDFIHPILRLPE